jgi:hypothetical protein
MEPGPGQVRMERYATTRAVPLAASGGHQFTTFTLPRAGSQKAVKLETFMHASDEMVQVELSIINY